MHKSYKYRIYPTDEQKVLLEKHFGACRLVYNLALQAKIWAWQTNRTNLSAYDLYHQLTVLKSEYGWLYEVSNESMQVSISHVANAFNNFFKGQDFPRFKNKKSPLKFTVLSDIKLGSRSLKVFKFKSGIRCIKHRDFDGDIKSCTTSKTCSNCGKVKDMPLSERTYNCECVLSLDRDINAAINIRNSGVKRSSELVESLQRGGTMKQEKEFAKDKNENRNK